MPQVITDQHIVKGQKQHGFPMRKWKISLLGINANGEEETLPYVDHVEYILHHTFEQPLRKVTEYPFELQEKGWGEFDMKIMLHFADKSTAPFVLDHDLNFQTGHYEIAHTLINIQVLAQKFQELEPDDLVELVKLVKANQTADMYVKEDGEAGEFHIDLRTLGDDLLKELWQFCAKRLDQM
ncbi:hypothetical protein BGZ68_009912 [Mortierella alpina]|nr:hypothetical protein BGZ68_009912 [Mortierella alpina]